MPKTIVLTIPDNCIAPEIISTFSPNEIYLMLKIGCECLEEGRKVIAGLSQQEIYNKIKEENRADLKKMELDLTVQREMSKQMEDKIEEKISKMYKLQIDRLEKQIELVNKQNSNMAYELKDYETEKKSIIKEEVDKVKERYDFLLEEKNKFYIKLLDEKDKQNILNRESFEKATTIINKSLYNSSKNKGNDGEDILFSYLSNVFKDFNGFQLEDKSKEGHKGDFHLFFEEFNILVDSKKYTTNVSKKEVDKIEVDLKTNDNIKFAWLISLDSDISNWNKFTIMNKWIMTENGMKCIIFVNNLLDNKEPQNIIRLVWSICNEFNKLIKDVKPDNNELQFYKERDLIFTQRFKKIQERNMEMRRNINHSLRILKDMDNETIDLLSLVSNEIINGECEKYNIINEWWDANIEYTSEATDILISTDLWSRFKRDNKEHIESKITVDKFKETLTEIVDSSRYVERTKKGAIEFIGYKYKVFSQATSQLEVELLIEETNIQKKPKKNKNAVVYYFDEQTDNKILTEYNILENDIMNISDTNKIPVWQVVSVLMKHKVILKRDDAKGYNIYKTTDEYKSKIKT